MTEIIKKNYKNKEQRDPLTERIIAAAYDVHNTLSPGFIEKIYGNALKVALAKRQLSFETEKEYRVDFENNAIGKFRADFIIEDQIILELKAVNGRLPKIFEYQMVSYLKASRLPVGLIINFGNVRCDVRRIILPLNTKVYAASTSP